MSDPVRLAVFAHRLQAICDEMGARLRRAAVSPNIRDRLDFSCALFSADGELLAQAAHIPVHLGSMAFAMRGVVARLNWRKGDLVVFNDPFEGGTHLPDVTVAMPLFIGDTRVGFAACRAHHAEIGGRAPGSMGTATRLADEGWVIAPTHWYRAGREAKAFVEAVQAHTHVPEERLADLAAQRAAVLAAQARVEEMDAAEFMALSEALLAVAEGYGRAAIDALPDGAYAASDLLDDDGAGNEDLPIAACITIEGETATVDFTGTAPAAAGPVNCPLAVTAASVFYVFRCLMPPHTPSTGSVFRPIRIVAPEGTLVHAPRGAPVAAGNVETSQRIVDVLLKALAQAAPERIPAAAQGTMNNIAFTGAGFSHYETLAGGMGAHPEGPGADAIQCHMTNTRLASAEVLEMYAPLRVVRTEIRRGSGGAGRHRGGDGIVREWEALAPCRVAWLTERRGHAPWGLAGGEPGAPGRNLLWRGGEWRTLPPKGEASLAPGERIRIETPGGGGWGKP
ncbi:MAG: hydantoinase B/oxoprolinase family protein [Zetaproteobacteria bacterium]|nr:MAG: hydantoinase B/oxoprolinase family protein [Zetaproteobacteria bacterium]